MAGLSITDISRVTGADIYYQVFEKGKVVFLPQRVALLGQGNTASTYALTKLSLTSAAQAATVYGYGSPLHLAAKQLFPQNGDGIGGIPVTVYPLEDGGSGVAATGDITASGATQTTDQIYEIKVNKIKTGEFQIPKTTTASAAITIFKTKIDAILDIPLTSGANTGVELILDLTSKWKGESANDIYVEITGVEDGLTFVVTQPTGGAVNPTVSTALALIGEVWETIILNLLNYDDTDILDEILAYGVGRWGKLVKKPLFSIVGTVDDYATRTAVTDARKTDRISALIPAVGSKELPSVIAARAVSRIAVTANENPPRGYTGRLTGLEPGADNVQEDYTTRNLAVGLGSGTTILVNREIELNDVLTMYHPDGEVPPAYRYVVKLVRLMNIDFNIRLIFENDEWKGAPMLPAGDPTVNPEAKTENDALTAMGNLATNLGLLAIISTPGFTQANMTAVISGQNSDRIDPKFPVKLSGNSEVISVEIPFGFYYGS